MTMAEPKIVTSTGQRVVVRPSARNTTLTAIQVGMFTIGCFDRANAKLLRDALSRALGRGEGWLKFQSSISGY